MSRKVFGIFGMLWVLAAGIASQSQAALIAWNIDSAQSYVRLNLPLTTTSEVDIAGVPTTVYIHLANQSQSAAGIGTALSTALSNGSWSDAQGRRAAIEGTLATNYFEEWFPTPGNSIEFLQGQHSSVAVQSFNAIPNPGVWNGSEYTDNSTAPAAFGVRLNAYTAINVFGTLRVALSSTVGYLAIRDVEYDIDGVVNLGGLAGNYGQAGGGIQLGVVAGSADIKGETPFGLSLLPSLRDEDLTGLTGGGLLSNVVNDLTITNLGGFDRRLTQTINIPLEFDVDGIILTGSIQGLLVATAAVPEPTSGILVGIGLVALLRRRRLSL